MDLNHVVNSRYLVIGVTGPYAGEKEEDILSRKIREAKEYGYTLWHHQSYLADPGQVQEFCNRAVMEGEIPYFTLISPASRRGGKDTERTPRATLYCEDKGRSYIKVPSNIYVETGRQGKPYALKIAELTKVNAQICLADYSMIKDRYANDKPAYEELSAVRPGQSASTLRIMRERPKDSSKVMKSSIRNVIAYAKLLKPYSVWLK